MTPVLFIGHGTPMNAIEDNRFSRQWVQLGKTLPRPKAILCVSAHWETARTKVTAMENPETIHDFGGFPHELYQQQYPAPGLPGLAEKICTLIPLVTPDHDWGLDHGAWSVLRHIYPDADIPVVQLSISRERDMQYHYDLGKALRFIRNEGVMIIGSGNMVHNLWMVRSGKDGFNNRLAYDWASRINEKIISAIMDRDHNSLIDYTGLDPETELAIPTQEHYIPLLYALGASDKEEEIEVFSNEVVSGSLSMASLVIGSFRRDQA